VRPIRCVQLEQISLALAVLIVDLQKVPVLVEAPTATAHRDNTQSSIIDDEHPPIIWIKQSRRLWWNRACHAVERAYDRRDGTTVQPGDTEGGLWSPETRSMGPEVS
jgi:hypothetical protein